MTDFILTRPALTPSGSYDPIELLRFIDLCRDNSVPAHQIADTLGIPLHRGIYAMGGGYPMIERRALAAMELRYLQRKVA